jgi:putative component of toxin-antitoxin plasmid stabilization module
LNTNWTKSQLCKWTIYCNRFIKSSPIKSSFKSSLSRYAIESRVENLQSLLPRRFKSLRLGDFDMRIKPHPQRTRIFIIDVEDIVWWNNSWVERTMIRITLNIIDSIVLPSIANTLTIGVIIAIIILVLDINSQTTFLHFIRIMFLW